MEQYFGTKKIQATPMTRAAYNEYRDWVLPSDENGADEGYLVEYLDGGKPNHHKHGGYISWSPKEQFENAYQPVTSMSFGHAIKAMEQGDKVSRMAWGIGNAAVYYVPAASYPAQRNTNETVVGEYKDDMVPYGPYMAIQSTRNPVQPFTPGIDSILASDWYIVRTDGYKPHQQRVVNEKLALDDKIEKLQHFIDNNPVFKELMEYEQEHLTIQIIHMIDYRDILVERISYF